MAGDNIDIHATRPEEAATLPALTRETGVFTDEEVTAVDELLGEYLRRGAQASGYFFLSGNGNGCVAGFTCFGPHPLTRGTWDLYWIAVSPAWQHHGLADALVRRTADEVRSLGGRLLIAETSSTPAYAPARRFYERHGFILTAVVPDFYAPGDNLLMYCQHL